MDKIKLVKLVKREMLEIKGGTSACICNGLRPEGSVKQEAKILTEPDEDL